MKKLSNAFAPQLARYVSIDFMRFQTHDGVVGPNAVSVGDNVLAPFPGDGANSYPFLYPAKVIQFNVRFGIKIKCIDHDTDVNVLRALLG